MRQTNDQRRRGVFHCRYIAANSRNRTQRVRCIRLATNTPGSGRGSWYVARAKVLSVGLSKDSPLPMGPAFEGAGAENGLVPCLQRSGFITY
jgi:hypothetical protein